MTSLNVVSRVTQRFYLPMGEELLDQPNKGRKTFQMSNKLTKPTFYHNNTFNRNSPPFKNYFINRFVTFNYKRALIINEVFDKQLL